MGHRNVVLICLDTLRSDCITYNGNSDFIHRYGPQGYSTPALNKIISEGLFFDNCISAAPYTTASHAAYFTGCWPLNNNVYEFFNKKLKKTTIFEHFRANGYDTYFNTDFEVILGPSLGLNNGVNHFYVEDEKTMLEDVIKHHGSPSLSFFHFGGIHYPYGFHKLKFADKDYKDKVAELERFYNLKEIVTEDMLDESYRDEEDLNLLLRYKNIVDYLYQNSLYDQLFKLYAEGIDYFMKHRFNDFIEKVIEFVDNTNALLVIFSDHGEDWSPKSKGHSNSVSDKVLKVPLMFYGKGIPKGVVKYDLIRTIDLLPTLLNLTGIKIKNKIDGKKIDFVGENLDRDCFAQVWRVGNKKKIISYQKKFLKSAKYIRPLKTNLEKEICFSGDLVFSKEYCKGNVITNLYSNRISHLREIDMSAERNRVKAFETKLSEYNSNKNNKENKNKQIRFEMEAELRALGYSI